MRHTFILYAACSLLEARKLPAQTDWTNFEFRTSLGVAANFATGSVVAFGGDRTGQQNYLDDTWQRSNAGGWSLRTAGLGPSPRAGHAMAYMPSLLDNATVVLFGGFGGRSSGSLALNAETWAWDGNYWTFVTAAVAPSARKWHGMASITSRNEVLLFGGFDASAHRQDTWAFGGPLGAWTQRFPASAPPARSKHAMAFANTSGKVLLFGGSPNLGDTWEYDPNAGTEGTWTQRAVLSGATPPPLSDATMAYDPLLDQLILYGGRDVNGSVLNYTWRWNPNLAPDGGWVNANPTASPGPRAGHAMAFDLTAARLVVVGGVDTAGQPVGGTWEWTGSNWVLRTPSPIYRYYSPLAYDSRRDRIVLFGGPGGLADTWEMRGGVWSEVTPAVSPAHRSAHGLAYDAARGRTVLFGGSSTVGQYNDTWEWDGALWHQTTPVQSPPHLGLPAMVFDAARGEIVLFGGSTATTGIFSADTWTYNGQTWTLRQPAHVPPARGYHAMAYDSLRQRVVLFGGWTYTASPIGDTWEWDGTDWTQRFPANSPSPRGAWMTFDEQRGRVVLFGGSPDGSAVYYSDSWEWDGTNWLLRSPAHSPVARMHAGIAFDAGRGRTVIFGGHGQAYPYSYSDTWEYGPLNAARFAPFAQGGLGCTGSLGVPSLVPNATNQLPWLGESFQVRLRGSPNQVALLLLGVSRDFYFGFPLPIDLGGLGMPGCRLHVSPDLVFGVPASGLTTLVVPGLLDLLGGSFYLQALVYDPPANLAGFTAATAIEAQIGAK